MAAILPLPASRRFSGRGHFLALRRSVAVAVVGLAVWIALACSAPSQAGGARASAPIRVPEWTLGGATSLDAARTLRSGAAPACRVH